MNQLESAEAGGRASNSFEFYNLLSRKWTMPVIYSLGIRESMRFNELKKGIPGISAASLSERVSELERLGIIERRVFPSTPPRVEYGLTEQGRELRGILCQLNTWFKKWKTSSERK